MDRYLVNKNAQPTGEHEVHNVSCNELPLPENQQHLGFCWTCIEAVKKAKEYYSDVDGCAFCCSSCHTR